ncbi:major histocompatibility complex class I-related gene protein-like [Amia ocellicauda]|uniref:major histocompatibility complex class I-related gene protein-like n=1 Tax=Amia ocellicauda TaxID=2972642 RepID=UPI003463B47D
MALDTSCYTTEMNSVKLLVLLWCIEAADAGSHSLCFLHTLNSQRTSFAEFTAVGMVNDLHVEYYDSDLKKIVSRQDWSVASDTQAEMDMRLAATVDSYHSIRTRIRNIMPRFNHTEGVHTYQRQACCELDDDGTTSVWVRDAYDGQDFMSYSSESHSWTAAVPQSITEKLHLEATKLGLIHFYRPACINILKKYLQYGKNSIMRKVYPRVRVIRKPSVAQGETHVTCLVTGFYPRTVEVTLLRDGHPVPGEKVTGGEVLPNGDGTYQLRKTLTVDQDEQWLHKYSCQVNHTSLDNKMVIDCELEPGPDLTIIIPVVVILLAVLVLLVAGVVLWWRRARNSIPDGQVDIRCKYTAASRQSASSSSSSVRE